MSELPFKESEQFATRYPNSISASIVTSKVPASRLVFDIEQTDSLAIDIGERVCLVGKCSTIVDRLTLPERYRGFAGNQCDIYQSVNFARQYGLDVKDMLRRIIVSRAFTIYQLVALITKELPQVVRRFDTKLLIIRDMLRMFIDSQIRIDEARPLIKEITDSLRIFSRDMSVIVSLSNVPSPQYKMLFSCFDRCIDLRTSHKPVVKTTCRGYPIVAAARGIEFTEVYQT